jgi:hypothetical protein
VSDEWIASLCVDILGLVKLYRPKEPPGHFVGEDRAGGLLLFPASPRGWSKRIAWQGTQRQLVEISPLEARGTGWPGAIGGKPRRTTASVHTVSVRVTTEERDLWQSAAGERRLSDWVRDSLNDIAAAAVRHSKPKP